MIKEKNNKIKILTVLLGIGFIMLGIWKILNIDLWKIAEIKSWLPSIVIIIFGILFLKIGFTSNKGQNEPANEPVKKEEKQLFENLDDQSNDIDEGKSEPVNELVSQIVNLSQNELNIIRLMTKNGYITQDEIARILHLSKSSVKRTILKLKEKEWITRVGSDKKGYWKILK